MATVNLEDPAFRPENENPRGRRSRPQLVPIVKSTELVKVACITELRPWVELPAVEKRTDDDGKEVEVKTTENRPLDHGEVVEIPAWIADILVANKHAVRV